MADLLAHRAVAAPRRRARTSFFTAMLDTWRQRHHLHRLDPHLRRDVGLSDHDVARETTRPIWDVPDSWRA